MSTKSSVDKDQLSAYIFADVLNLDTLAWVEAVARLCVLGKHGPVHEMGEAVGKLLAAVSKGPAVFADAVYSAPPPETTNLRS